MTSDGRNRVVAAASIPLTADPLDPDQVVSGSPQVSGHEILTDERMSVGVWQHTTGVSTDVEADEVFVVLVGRATIEIAGGPTLEVGPGDVGVLAAGSATRWTIHEDLRKVYVTAHFCKLILDMMSGFNAFGRHLLQDQLGGVEGVERLGQRPGEDAGASSAASNTAGSPGMSWIRKSESCAATSSFCQVSFHHENPRTRGHRSLSNWFSARCAQVAGSTRGLFFVTPNSATMIGLSASCRNRG